MSQTISREPPVSFSTTIGAAQRLHYFDEHGESEPMVAYRCNIILVPTDKKEREKYVYLVTKVLLNQDFIL